MTNNFFALKKTGTFLIMLFLIQGLFAQNQNPCDNGDCSSEIFKVTDDIPLDLDPNGLSLQERADLLGKIYLRVKAIQNKDASKSKWQKKYNEKSLGGINCVRQYHWNGIFAHEFEQNKEFRKFIRQQEPSVNAFKRKGFESSRRAINLMTRMKNQCPRQLKKLEESTGPGSEEIPTIYRKLGEVLGYFDSEGKQVRPIDLPDEVLALQDKMEDALIDEDIQDAVEEADQKVKAQEGQANGLMDESEKQQAQINEALNDVKNTLSDAEDILKEADDLKDIVDNELSGNGPVDEIKELTDAGNELKDKVNNLGNKPDELANKVDNLAEKMANTKGDIQGKTAKIESLKDDLNDLVKTKEDLRNQLDQAREATPELAQLVDKYTADASQINDQIANELDQEDGFDDQLSDLATQQKNLVPELEEVAKAVEDIKESGKELLDQSQAVQKDVKEAQQLNNEIQDLKNDLNAMDTEAEGKKIEECEKELLAARDKINPLKGSDGRLQEKLDRLKTGPTDLFDRLANLKDIHDGMLSGIGGEANMDPGSLAKINQLIDTRNVLQGKLSELAGKPGVLQGQLDDIQQSINTVKEDFNRELTNLGNLKEELKEIVDEKIDLQLKLDQPFESLADMRSKVKNLVAAFKVFKKKPKCKEVDGIWSKIKDLLNEEEALEPELEGFENDLNQLRREGDDLKEKTEAVVKELKEGHRKKQQALEAQEKDYAGGVRRRGGVSSTNMVEVGEWAESFEVKRPYWDAVFHPDDEVVEGFKGKYFEVQLKDAEKNVSLLFRSGKTYFMDKKDFREKYGSTIGAFVTEALHYMRKADEGAVKLFVQGSADISGQETFRGKLDERYFYEEVTVLPKKEDDETFFSKEVNKTIPQQGFTNSDLPDLRGNFLKEMISIYSRKLKPVLLEGAVQEVKGEKERNAVIYLFFPEEVLAKYDR